MHKFKGIFPALLTPYDKSGKINEKALAALIEMNISKGVDGFYVCGSTSEVFMLENAERRFLMKTVKDIVGGRVALIAHVGSVSTGEAVSLAAYAGELGYDAVSAVPPFYYKFTFGEIKDYYFSIADGVGLPVIIYNIPVFSGVTFNMENISSFMDDARFIGIKHTSNDFFLLERMREAYPAKALFNGYDELFLSGLIAGADGGIGSTYNFMAEKFIKMQSLYTAGKIDEARAVQHEVNLIISYLIKTGVMAGEKAVLNLMGYGFGGCRRPFADCSREQYDMLEKNVLPLLSRCDKR